MKKVKILNVQFDACTKDEILERIFDALDNRSNEGAKQIVTPNPEMILEAQRNKEFLETLNRAFISIPDGIGILWAATFQNISRGNKIFMRYLKAFASGLSLFIYPKYCRKIFRERVSGVDLMESICSMSRKTQSRQAYGVFLLGAKVGVSEKAKEFLETKYPGINIVGTFAGSPKEYDFPAVQSVIAETRPSILFVAYGSPKQELWIIQHLRNLPSIKIAMGVGGSFDFISGFRKRAPKWMQKLGIEWLYRLIQEPSRIRRIYNAVIKFPLMTIKQTTDNRQQTTEN